MSAHSGYHDCPCRDCFEIAIGEALKDGRPILNRRGETRPALCHSCLVAGCDHTGRSECESPSAYGCTDE